jgi:hypothetical protein
MATLEDLRAAIRRSRAPHVRGLDATEFAVLRTRGGGGCALRTRQVTIEPELPLLGGPITPLKPVKRKPNEGEDFPPLRVTHGAPKPDPGPPTTVTPASPAGQLGTRKSNPFVFSTITDVGHTEGANETAEPSQASAGNVVWYTGNDDRDDGAAYSLDHGATFTHVDPRKMFPEGDHAFCCDQVVIYAPQINRFIWFIQYWCPEPDQRCAEPRSSNQDRLLIASPQEIAKDPTGAWKSWVIRPQDLHAPHQWLDYPDLGLGRHSLYITSNVFGGAVSSVVARVALSDLKAEGNLKLRYFDDPDHGSYRAVQGSKTRGTLVSHDSDSRLMALTWEEGSPLLLLHRPGHSVEATDDAESSPDAFGTHDAWNSRSDDRILGATRRGNTVWVAWNEGRSRCVARCEGDHPKEQKLWAQPHVHIVVLNARTLRRVRERFIYNDHFAIAYPSLASNSLGQVAMTFSYGGGTAGNASPAAGFLTGGEAFRQVAPSPAAGQQADYFSLRPDWPDGKRFTASGYVSADTGDGYPSVHWLFYRFSRHG